MCQGIIKQSVCELKKLTYDINLKEIKDGLREEETRTRNSPVSIFKGKFDS